MLSVYWLYLDPICLVNILITPYAPAPKRSVLEHQLYLLPDPPTPFYVSGIYSVATLKASPRECKGKENNIDQSGRLQRGLLQPLSDFLNRRLFTLHGFFAALLYSLDALPTCRAITGLLLLLFLQLGSFLRCSLGCSLLLCPPRFLTAKLLTPLLRLLRLDLAEEVGGLADGVARLDAVGSPDVGDSELRRRKLGQDSFGGSGQVGRDEAGEKMHVVDGHADNSGALVGLLGCELVVNLIVLK